MRRRDVDKLRVDDYIELKHNLGKGTITQIVMDITDTSPTVGRYPMIEFVDDVGLAKTWCTYLAIEFWPNPAIVRRSKT